jgi:hypothetical protein
VLSEASSGRKDARLRRTSNPATATRKPASSERRRESKSGCFCWEFFALDSLDFDGVAADESPILLPSLCEAALKSRCQVSGVRFQGTNNSLAPDA